MSYTTIERSSRIYNTVAEVFNYSKNSDIVTPIELVRQQVSTVKPTDRVCVPGAGIGTHVLALIERGVEPKNIFAVEIDSKYYELGSNMFQRFGVNYVHADFLTWQPEMQFDVIIGNPPYQDASTASHDKKLWTKFFDRSLELLTAGGILSFVTPNSLVGRTRLPAKRRIQLSTIYSLESIDHTTNSYFPQVGVDVCSWVVKKIPYGGATQVIDSGGARVVDLCEELPVPMTTKIVDDLVEKIRDGIGPHGVPELKRQYNDIDQTPTEEGSFVNYYSGRHKSFRTNDTCKNTGQLKVVFSFSATYKQWFITDQNVSGTNVYVTVTSVEEGVEIGESLMHPIITYYIDNWRRTAGFCPAIKNNGALPDVRGLSTEDLIDKFSLTTEEVELIYGSYSPYKEVSRVIGVGK
jgi:predicted RNA methylase